MLAIVGKATQNDNGDIELYLREFKQMLVKQEQFVYAWSFNPDKAAIDYLRRSLNRNDDVFLYLPAPGGLSALRMRVANFHHERASSGTACSGKWSQYCIPDLLDLCAFQTKPPMPIHLWFLIRSIECLSKPFNLRTAFRPIFPNKYWMWGQNFFAFLSPVQATTLTVQSK